MNSNFLEPRNITSLINTVRSNVRQEINYDIANDQKYINVLKKLVKTIHEANINNEVSIDYMNNLVVTKCVPFLVNQVKKKNSENKIPPHLPPKISLYGTLPLNTNDRPVTSRVTDTSFEKATLSNSNSLNILTDFSSLTLGGYNNSIQSQGQGQMFERGQNPVINSNLNIDPPPRQMPNLNLNSQSNELGEAMNMEMNSTSQNFMRQNHQMNFQDNSMETQFRDPPLVNSNINESNFIRNQAGVNSQDLEPDNVDLAARLEAAQKERGLDIAGPQLPTQPRQNLSGSLNDTIVNNSLQERERKIETNNSEFFRKLESNNNNTQTKERDQQLSIMNIGNHMSSGDVGNLELGESVYNAYSNNSITSSMVQLGAQNSMNASDQILNFKDNLNDKTNVLKNDDNDNSNNNNVEQQGLGIDSYIKNQVMERDTEGKKKLSKEYIDQTYLSTSYQFERRKRKILCLDISETLTNMNLNGSDTKKVIENISNSYWGKFRLNLHDTLIIDKVSDIYIESIIINNPAQANTYSNLYIVMDIDEFNIKTLSNNLIMMDKFVLPNENTESVGSSKIMKYHLKSNYVATINPTRLSSLTFNITNENGESVENTFTYTNENVADDYNIGYTGNISINVHDNSNLFDAIYNSSYQFIGNINTTDTENKTISLMKSLNANIINGEKLYYPSSRTSNYTTAIIEYGDKTITVNSDPTVDFSIGDFIYIGTGAILGKIKSMNSVHPETITFETEITKYLSSNISLYTSNPLPRVFASNDKSNRIIFELVIIPR